MMISENNLPRIGEYPGELSGYYTINRVRYLYTSNGGKCCSANWAQFAPENSAKVWNDLRSYYPESEPVWLNLERARCEFRPVISFRPVFVLNEQLLSKVRQFRLDPKLHTFPCKFIFRGAEVSAPNYFGIYGDRCEPDSGLGIQKPLMPENGLSLPPESDFRLFFVGAKQPELQTFDLFVGPRGELFFSERLVEVLIYEDRDLQFDPVLFDTSELTSESE